MATGLGRVVHRAITLECVHDFQQMTSAHQLEVVTKVAIVGAVALGLTILAGLISLKFLWAIPLTTVLAMGGSFLINSDPRNITHHAGPHGAPPQWIVNLLRWITGSP